MKKTLRTWLNSPEQLYQRYRACFAVRPLARAQRDINSWFTSAPGQRVLHQQQLCLEQLLPEMFGYHLMQLSVLSDHCLFSSSSTSHQFSLSPSLPRGRQPYRSSSAAAVSAFEQLPVASNSIDVVLLHHVLDFSLNPHQLLREATRATIPNGYIVIVGFNPFSLQGMIDPIACLLSHSDFYRHHYLRVNRLKDWFKVLGLDLVYDRRGCYGLPLARGYSPVMETMGQYIAPLSGSFYVLVVRKNVVSLPPMKTRWAKKHLLPKWKKGITASSPSSTISTDSSKRH